MRALLIASAFSLVGLCHAIEPIGSVTLDGNRAFRVNGRPFFPIMIWLQDPANFPRSQAAGINTVAGYWPGSGGTKDVAEYMERVSEAGFYGVLPFHEGLINHPGLLGYIHSDEPDKPHQESDAEVIPAEGLRINNSTPLWKIVDGGGTTWSVMDPLEGAAVTIRRKEPVTVRELAVWVTVSPGLAVAKDVRFVADGAEIARATLKSERGRQRIALAQPATFSELTMHVDSTYPGEQVWGSIGEIEGFDAEDTNLLLSVPRQVPESAPEVVQAVYDQIRAADPSRPVFLTFTANFMPEFNRLGDEQRLSLYPQYAQAADVLGFDIYPIYGWGRPDWINLVYDGAVQLQQLAGHRATYQWIETSKGGQWVGEEGQKDVTPEHIRSQVWMAICGGATSIGYFTHIWKPSYRQFGTPQENIEAMREINDQITRLAPAILAAPAAEKVTIEIADGVRGAVLAKRAEDGLYLFAVNYDEKDRGGMARISVEGLAAGTQVGVVDEDRSLVAEEGFFADQFDPLAVHIYRTK